MGGWSAEWEGGEGVLLCLTCAYGQYIHLLLNDIPPPPHWFCFVTLSPVMCN